MPTTKRRILCVACDPTGRGRSCARRRCYCGHPECWAAASYVDLSRVRVRVADADDHPLSRAAAAWDNRQEDTWLDRL
jgi:hypothetical protein